MSDDGPRESGQSAKEGRPMATDILTSETLRALLDKAGLPVTARFT